MRDPNRIHDVLMELEKLWVRYPDWRFMQLINNLQATQGNDMFYIEDNKFINIIEDKINHGFQENKMSFTSIIQKFIQENIDEYIEVSSDCERFECDLEEEVIYIPTKANKEDTDMFMRFIEQEYKEYELNPIVMGILHEVGHIMMYDEDLDKAREIAALRMRLNFNNSELSLEEYNFNYFKIPAELNATNWAIDFYRNNREKCDRLGVMLNG